MHDDPADQRHQHEHAGDADDVQADHAGVQVVVQGEEEFAADRLRQGFAGLRVELEVDELAEVRRHPAGRPVGNALGRRAHPEGMSVGLALREPVAHLVGAHRVFHRLVQLRQHPAGEFLVEAGQAAAEQDDEQQPADQQPAPGVQAGHGLAQAHGRTPKPAGRKAAAASSALTARGSSQARQALRVAKTKMIAATQKAKHARLAKATRSARASGR
ncbi:hypothetical protein D3C80_1508050 [compost metagenome]